MRWCCIFLIFWVAAAKAQPDTSRHESFSDVRGHYIKRYPDHFWIWPVVKSRSLDFKAQNVDTDEQTKFKPNGRTALGAGFYLFEIAAEIAFSIPESQESIDQFGESQVRDLQVNAIGKFWGLDVYWQRYRGFYLDDAGGASDFSKRADIHSSNLGVSGFYAFNRSKFSLRSSYNFSERQLHSGGSWMLIGTVNSFTLAADSVVGDVGSEFLSMRYTTFGLAPGYSYNLIIKKFFVNGTFGLGPAHNWLRVKDGQGDESNNISISSISVVRVGLGYNSDRFFGGVAFSIQSRNLRLEDTRFTNSTSIVKIMAGYRFREVGILKKRAVDLFRHHR
jgi:hypothetical protein